MKTIRSLVPAMAVIVMALFCASGASADDLYTWGISGITPSLDTANGDDNSSSTPGLTSNSVCPDGITCSPQVNSLSQTNPLLPAPFRGESTMNAPHSGEDVGIWDPAVRAPHGGQVLSIKVTGCAVEDTSSPTQDSQGIPVNTALFQTLTPDGTSWTVDSTAGAPASGPYPFQVPFCETSANPSGVPADTVTTFIPDRLCISAGDVVAFHDLGGFVDNSDNSSFHYPQGIPMKVLAPLSSVSTDSFIGVGVSSIGPGVYGTADTTTPQQDEAGYATESDQEVTMQMVEGTGDDAYGVCPGGFGDEPTNGSNAIDCDFTTSADGTHAVNPTQYPDHPFCAGSGMPIPGSNVPSTGGTTGTGSTGSTGSGGTTRATAPVLTKLKMNPPLFVAKRGAVITYVDSHPGQTTLRFYRVTGKHDVLVKALTHQDKVKVGFHISGFSPGSYVVKASSVYRKLHGATVITTFRVILKRGVATTAPVLTRLTMNPPLFVARRGAVITYVDSHPGLTTLRFYRVTGTHEVLVKTITHQDKVKVGFHVGGFSPGSYVVRASSAYKSLRGATVIAKFRVIAKR